jgi:GntR family transcriptional regulator of arabinose operon
MPYHQQSPSVLLDRLAKPANAKKQTKYLFVLESLRESIQAKKYVIGDRLPTEKEIAKTYHVSLQTVKEALLRLKLEGIIRQVPGSGTFLQAMPGETPPEVSHAGPAFNIGFLSWESSIHVFPRIINAVEHTIFPRGFHIIPCSTNDNAENEWQIIQRLIQQGVKGFIISPIIWHARKLNNYEYLRQQGIPFVFINRRVPEIEASAVTVNNFSGARRATSQLIKMGHRRVGHITISDPYDQTIDRINGYKQALEDHGLPFDSELITSDETDNEFIGYGAAQRLLDRKDRPTAIFCVNDEHALGLCEAARRLGLVIPRDLSVLAFDNSIISRLYFPFQLDTVEYPAEEMGTFAANELLGQIEGKYSAVKNICFEPQLLVRESCAPPAKKLLTV